MRFEAEQLRRLGINGAAQGLLVLEPDGDPNPGYTVRMIRDNRAAVVNPDVSNDQTQGYSPGSLWVNTSAPAAVWFCASAATGAAVWAEVGAFGGITTPGDISGVVGQSKVAPGEYPLGNVMDYHATGTVTASRIQYARVWLEKDIIFNRMVTYVSAGANGTRDLRLGIFDQTNPLLDTLGPNARVAQTNLIVPTINGRQVAQLTNAVTGGSGTPTTWVVPARGYYWTAFITDETALQFAISDIYPSALVPVLFEAGAGTTLPATSVTALSATSSVVYVAAKEV